MQRYDEVTRCLHAQKHLETEQGYLKIMANSENNFQIQGLMFDPHQERHRGVVQNQQFGQTESIAVKAPPTLSLMNRILIRLYSEYMVTVTFPGLNR